MRNPTAEDAGYYDHEDEVIDTMSYYRKWVKNARKARLMGALPPAEKMWPCFDKQDQLFALERAAWWRERLLKEKRWQKLMTQASAAN